jgi:uncharacterized protein YjbJ (UPF0337 family)
MGKADKASNKIQDLKGRAKQMTGRATGDKDLESEGKVDQIVAAAKDVGEKVKEAGATVERIVKR